MRRPQIIGALLLLMAEACISAARADEAPFAVTTLPAAGRTVAAELVELNGDGRTDLLQIVVDGLPPDEERTVRVYYQDAQGAFSAPPSIEIPLPPDCGGYDLGDVRAAPGVELILARPADLTILSLNDHVAERWVLPLPPPGSVWPGRDDRGLERVSLLCNTCGDDAVFLVPQFGNLAVLSATGGLVAQLDVGGRVNYLVPARPSVLFSESELQVFVDVPRLSLGDVDGDGSVDIVSASRHDVRVFLNRGNGRFAREPSRVSPLRVITERDHVRGAGGASAQAADIDGDGRLDLLVSHLSGGLADAQLEARLYINAGGEWDLDHPTSILNAKAALGSDTLLDLDGDGRLELLRLAMPFSVLELIEALVTRAVDAQFSIFRLTEQRVLASTPWATVNVDLPINFETFRARGFLPAWHLDLNGDGQRDLLTSGGGKRIEISLGGGARPYKDTDARQDADTQGLLHTGDIDGDHLPDLVVYDPLTSDAGVRVFRNRGILPGNRRQQPSISASPTPESPLTSLLDGDIMISYGDNR